MGCSCWGGYSVNMVRVGVGKLERDVMRANMTGGVGDVSRLHSASCN
jgi:hypothetical protein